MFAETITITINSVAKVLVRINQDGYSSEYRLKGTTDEFSLKIRNSSYTDRNRGAKVVDKHNVEFTHTVYPVAPAIYPTVRKAYTVLLNDSVDAITEPLNFDLGFAGFFTNANVTKLLNWES